MWFRAVKEIRAMHENPLSDPRDMALLQQFRDQFRPPAGLPPREELRLLVTAFARLPYENLTKIIKRHATGRSSESRRAPAEVLADYYCYGSGGTCFSLTAALLHLVRSLGWEAEPLLADRRYGPDTHCALIIQLEGRPHLVDPGYLILDPIPLEPTRTQRVRTAFNDLILTPGSGGRTLDLSTVSGGRERYRLTFKTGAVDCGQFLRAWDASFDWEMMQYPVRTRVRGNRQLYLQGRQVQTRTRASVRREELPPSELAPRVAADFGIAPELAARALAILHRRNSGAIVRK
jgi:arylamine N-acetyltransferase